MSTTLRDLLARLGRAISPGGSLTQQSLAGGFWMGLTNVLGRLLQLGMVLVLANLLSPRQFGVVGIAILVLSAANRLSRLGIDDALIHDQETNVDRYLNTTWTLNVGRGVLLAALLVGSAPLVSAFFREPLVAEVLPAMAVGPLLYGLRNPGIVYFKKELDFHRQFLYAMSGPVLQFLVGVGYAWFDPSIWALALAYVASDGGRTVASYALHGFRPRPGFDRELASSLVGYGKWMTGTHALNFLLNEGDDALVGWLLTASSLGAYQMAYRFSNAPATEIAHVISGVAFPVYARLQNDLQSLRTGFFRVTSLTGLVTVPAGVGIAVVAPTFSNAFLGEQWAGIIVPMQILAFYGIFRSLGSTFGSVWRAVGRPDFLAKFNALSVAATAVVVYPLTDAYGIAGTSVAILAADGIATTPIGAYYTLKQIDASAGAFLRTVAYPVVASAFMGLVVLAARNSLALRWPLVEFVFLVVLGVVSYAVAVLVLETQFDWGLRVQIRNVQNAL